MNENSYSVIFKFGKLGLYGIIPGIKKAMQRELLRVYNIYADKCNSGITDMLNTQFDQLYPNYFEENEGKNWCDSEQYNRFIADGYNQAIVDELNKTNASPILDFCVEPEEVGFIGYLKSNRDATIKFYLKEA